MLVFPSEEAARFTKNLSNVEGTETNTVKMICEVSKAGAEVTWYRGDEELPEGGRYDQQTDGRKRILIIRDLRMEDAGDYNCRLSPTIRTSATLKLNGKTRRLLFDFIEETEVTNYLPESLFSL